MGGHLDFLFGVMLTASPVLVIPSCASDGLRALYRSCNLTQVPPVPSTTQTLLLSFNYIQTVTTTSFPFLERLQLLSLGLSLSPSPLAENPSESCPT